MHDKLIVAANKLLSASEMSVLGFLGAAITALFGGWSQAMTTLMIFMIIDYLSGLCCGIAGKSKKTKKGGLSSKVGLIGILKKLMMIAVVVVAYRIDLLMNLDSSYVKDGTCIAFIINETISILENAGTFIPIPAPIKRAIDVLKTENEGDKK